LKLLLTDHRHAGLTVDNLAPRFSFFFGIGMNFFMEVAKLRAARKVWSQLVREKFNAKDERCHPPSPIDLRMLVRRV